jgi:H+/Cl- antiporter ClcA
LQERFGASVVVVTEPPPTNESEYLRITIVNVIATILWSFVALLVAFILTGALSRAVLRRLRLPLIAKRAIFVLVNSWLVAPLPFQGGFIFVFPGPNLLAFPWADSSFYSGVASFAAVSFPCTLVLCAVVSVFLFRSDPENRLPQSLRRYDNNLALRRRG